MTDYTRNIAANEWAYRHRWFVWLSTPAALVLYWFGTI